MKNMIALLMIGLLVAANTCQNDASNRESLPDAIRMIKTPCKGVCPVYNMEINSDGVATLEGKQNLDLIGLFTRELNDTEKSGLYRVWNKVNWQNLEDEYVEKAMDIPVTYFEVRSGEHLQTVRFDRSAPTQLIEMMTYLENIATQGEWNKSSN